MYQFNIIKLDEGGFKFELGAIKMFIDDFTIRNNKHSIKNPDKAIGYFSFDGNIYGVSNNALNIDTVEAFYDSMSKQYAMFNNDKRNNQFPLKQSA